MYDSLCVELAAFMLPLGVVWYFAAGAIAIGVAGGILAAVVVGGIINFFREKRYVAVHAPLMVLSVGGTGTLKATLIKKKRFSSAKWAAVAGTVTITNASTNYSLPGGVATLSIPVGVGGGSTVLTGIAVGSGTAVVTGTDAAGDSYRSMTVQVEVIALPPGGIIGFYNAAVAQATGYWTNSWLGNICVNWLGLGRGGLCDEWAEWTSQWIMENHGGTVCRCEQVFWPGVIGGIGQHVCIRITLCAPNGTCTGPVYYLDPHRESNQPAMLLAAYEAKYGKPPGPNFVLWTAPCTAAGVGGPGSPGGSGSGGSEGE